MQSLIVAALLFAAVGAVPNGSSKKPSCSNVKKAITIAKQQSAAAAFCASYLSISQRTTTILQTALTTITVPIAPSTTTTTVSTTTVTSTASVTSCINPTAISGNVKREAAYGKPKSKPKPRCFDPYINRQSISSVCSCLSIPETVSTTSTTTQTVNQDAPATTTYTATTTATESQTITQYVLPDPAQTPFKLFAIDNPNDSGVADFDGVYLGSIGFGDATRYASFNEPDQLRGYTFLTSSAVPGVGSDALIVQSEGSQQGSGVSPGQLLVQPNSAGMTPRDGAIRYSTSLVGNSFVRCRFVGNNAETGVCPVSCRASFSDSQNVERDALWRSLPGGGVDEFITFAVTPDAS